MVHGFITHHYGEGMAKARWHECVAEISCSNRLLGKEQSGEHELDQLLLATPPPNGFMAS